MTATKMCYDGVRQCLHLQLGNESCNVRDGWANKSPFSENIDRIKMYSELRILTIDEILNDSITKPREYDYPWEAFGSMPLSYKEKVEAWLERNMTISYISWWESFWLQAYDSYQIIRDEALAMDSRILCICADGPHKGDAVNTLERDPRINYNGSIYERRNDEQLHYVRPV